MASYSSVVSSALPVMLEGLDKKKEKFIQEIQKVVAKLKEKAKDENQVMKVIETINNLGLFFDNVIPGYATGDAPLKESSSPSTYGRLEPHLVERIQSLETEVAAIQRSQNNDQNRMNAIQADVTSVCSDVSEMKSKMADFEAANGVEMQTLKEDIASLKSGQFRELETIEKLASDSEKCLERTGKLDSDTEKCLEITERLESEIENLQKTAADEAGKQKAATDREAAELKSIRRHVKDTKDKLNTLEMEIGAKNVLYDRKMSSLESLRSILNKKAADKDRTLPKHDDSWKVLPVFGKVDHDVRLKVFDDGPETIEVDTSENYDKDGKYFTVPVSGFYTCMFSISDYCSPGYANLALYKDDEGNMEPVRYSTTPLHQQSWQYKTTSIVSLIRLNAGDKVKCYKSWDDVKLSWNLRLVGN